MFYSLLFRRKVFWSLFGRWMGRRGYEKLTTNGDIGWGSIKFYFCGDVHIEWPPSSIQRFKLYSWKKTYLTPKALEIYCNVSRCRLCNTVFDGILERPKYFLSKADVFLNFVEYFCIFRVKFSKFTGKHLYRCLSRLKTWNLLKSDSRAAVFQ